jgi:hypothetical protein
MKTGVNPIGDMEYDIDIGLRFPFSEQKHDAKVVRGWILEAIDSHTKRIESLPSCIRVSYEAGYHLDIVSYAVWNDAAGTMQFRLAHRENGWRSADPPGLLAYFNDARKPFEGTEDSLTQTDQLRRCVRALRRWADELRPTDGDHCKPSGIGFVLMAIQYGLAPATFLDKRSNDRQALEQLCSALSNTVGRIVARKPTPEYDDVLSELLDAEMVSLKDECRELHSALDFAGTNADPVAACKRLRKVFGKDFPIPEPDETAKKSSAPTIITHSGSA